MNPRVNRSLRILLFVEADQTLARATQVGLEAAGLRVIFSERYTDIVDWVFDYRDYPPDAVVIDFPISAADVVSRAFDLYRLVRHGASLPHRAQRFSGWGLQLPVILLIPDQDRSQAERRLVNDYAVYAQFVHKPFTPDLLANRIFSLLALLTPMAQPAAAPPAAETLIVDNLIIDLGRKRVLVDGEEIHFSDTEYNVLCYLATHHDTVVSRRTLLGEVWGKPRPTAAETRYPDEYVKRIKQKLKNTSCAQMIDAKYGEGYVLSTSKARREAQPQPLAATQPVVGGDQTAQRQAYLILMDGGANHAHLQATSAEFYVQATDAGGFKIGRDPNQVQGVIDDSGDHFRRVSRLHAIIFERDGDFYIRDAHSSGGTTLARRNSEGVIEKLRVPPTHELALKHNDLIHFNVVVYRFEVRYR